MADKTLSFAELERRSRATARAQAIWRGAVAILATKPWTLGECIHESERHWGELHARCVDAEPASDETEFAFGIGATQGQADMIEG